MLHSINKNFIDPLYLSQILCLLLLFHCSYGNQIHLEFGDWVLLLVSYHPEIQLSPLHLRISLYSIETVPTVISGLQRRDTKELFQDNGTCLANYFSKQCGRCVSWTLLRWVNSSSAIMHFNPIFLSIPIFSLYSVKKVLYFSFM